MSATAEQPCSCRHLTSTATDAGDEPSACRLFSCCPSFLFPPITGRLQPMLQPPRSGAAAPCGVGRRKERPAMATLASLQGQGGGRIPMGGFSYAVSQRDLAAI